MSFFVENKSPKSKTFTKNSIEQETHQMSQPKDFNTNETNKL